MGNDPLRRVRPGTWFILAALAVVLSGCFQNAGETIVPTPVNLTAIAPKSPTPFVTPISTTGFVAPPNDTPVVEVTAIPTEIPLDTPAPTLDPGTIITPLPSPAVVAPTGLPPTPTALPTEGPCTHTVQPGEWLMSIARKYNISLDQLLAVNQSNAQNPNRILQPGDVLNIPNCGQQAAPPTSALANAPAPTSAPAAAQATALPSGLATPIPPTNRIYTVASGDTLGLIARKFDTTVQAIKEANGLTNDFLSVGQQLKIPK